MSGGADDGDGHTDEDDRPDDAERAVDREEGTDLGIPGYESLVKLSGFDNVFAGNAGVAVDKSNMSEYDF